MGTVVVSIPPRAELLHVLRSVVASVAAAHDFRVDVIEDLRIAVDEACVQLLSANVPTQTLTLSLQPSSDALEVTASLSSSPAQWPPEGARDSLAWRVLTALVDDADFEQHDGKVCIRFVKSSL